MLMKQNVKTVCKTQHVQSRKLKNFVSQHESLRNYWSRLFCNLSTFLTYQQLCAYNWKAFWKTNPISDVKPSTSRVHNQRPPIKCKESSWTTCWLMKESKSLGTCTSPMRMYCRAYFSQMNNQPWSSATALCLCLCKRRMLLCHGSLSSNERWRKPFLWWTVKPFPVWWLTRSLYV